MHKPLTSAVSYLLKIFQRLPSIPPVITAIIDNTGSADGDSQRGVYQFNADERKRSCSAGIEVMHWDNPVGQPSPFHTL